MGSLEACKNQIQDAHHPFSQDETAGKDDDRGFFLPTINPPVPADNPANGAGKSEGGLVIYPCERSDLPGIPGSVIYTHQQQRQCLQAPTLATTCHDL